jgi:hypothetical protein
MGWKCSFSKLTSAFQLFNLTLVRFQVPKTTQPKFYDILYLVEFISKICCDQKWALCSYIRSRCALKASMSLLEQGFRSRFCKSVQLISTPPVLSIQESPSPYSLQPAAIPKAETFQKKRAPKAAEASSSSSQSQQHVQLPTLSEEFLSVYMDSLNSPDEVNGFVDTVTRVGQRRILALLTAGQSSGLKDVKPQSTALMPKLARIRKEDAASPRGPISSPRDAAPLNKPKPTAKFHLDSAMRGEQDEEAPPRSKAKRKRVVAAPAVQTYHTSSSADDNDAMDISD